MNLFGESGHPRRFFRTGGFNRHVKPERGHSDVWLTPRYLIDALGPFDLDPCAAEPRPWDCAVKNITKLQDGLAEEWSGFVWLNPPYSEVGQWLGRLAQHPQGGIALVFARTDVSWFQQHGTASSLQLWLSGRVVFLQASGAKPKGNAGASSVLLAYGDEASRRLQRSGLRGFFTTMQL